MAAIFSDEAGLQLPADGRSPPPATFA